MKIPPQLDQILAVIVLAYFAYRGISTLWAKKRLKEILEKPAPELRELCGKSNPMLRMMIGAELSNRGEDISFLLPASLEMALSKNMTTRIVGVTFLRAQYPEVLKGLEFKSTLRLKNKERERLLEIQRQLETQFKPTN